MTHYTDDAPRRVHPEVDQWDMECPLCGVGFRGVTDDPDMHAFCGQCAGLSHFERLVVAELGEIRHALAALAAAAVHVQKRFAPARDDATPELLAALDRLLSEVGDDGITRAGVEQAIAAIRKADPQSKWAAR